MQRNSVSERKHVKSKVQVKGIAAARYPIPDKQPLNGPTPQANGGYIADFRLNHQVEIILMDTMMLEMDGLEATRLIREMPIHKHLPIVSLTAMKGDREKCFEAGVSDYITKPVDEDTLLATIYAWLMVKPDAIEN